MEGSMVRGFRGPVRRSGAGFAGVISEVVGIDMVTAVCCSAKGVVSSSGSGVSGFEGCHNGHFFASSEPAGTSTTSLDVCEHRTFILDHIWNHQRYVFACEQVSFFDFHELLDGVFLEWESGSCHRCLEASPQRITHSTAIITCLVYGGDKRSLLLLLTSVLLGFRLNIPMVYGIVFFL